MLSITFIQKFTTTYIICLTRHVPQGNTSDLLDILAIVNYYYEIINCQSICLHGHLFQSYVTLNVLALAYPCASLIVRVSLSPLLQGHIS